MYNHQKEIENRALEEARYLIDNHATVRQTAKIFGVSKSTVHKDIVERLPNYSFVLAKEAHNVLAENKAERTLRGRLATQKKYLLLRENKVH